MQIKSVEAHPVRIPLAEPYRESEAEIESFNHVITVVRTKEEMGLGEADFLSLAQHSAPTVASTIDRIVADLIVDMNVFNIEKILERVYEATNLVLSPEATAATISAIDLALWDIQGKALDLPVYKLLGGKVTDEIEVSFTLSAESPADMADSARKRTAQGYRTLVVKAGRGGLNVDEERVRAVRETVDSDVQIRIDINGGYSDLKEAKTAIDTFEEYDIEYVEQPLARGNREGTAELRGAVDVPIVADESLVTLDDAFALSTGRVFDAFNIKPTKCGGLHTACKVATVAESADLHCLVGGHPQQEIARQASRHFAAARTAVNCGYANEGPGPASQSLTDHITTDVVTYEDVSAFDGFVPVPDEPGLGVELDRDALNRYRIDMSSCSFE